ncbi:MAG: type II toxin-antitoxin system prevent-host-death family antitoxin [Spirochaetes bacterium]|nr:type II toxin-antitoxin system prevent-host-death family antitoxin [Spirochaetota bacterium]
MPEIRKSADLRNKYGEISDFCHRYREPVFITKNGQGDLAVMSIEVYEELASRYKLYEAIHTGLDQIKNGEVIFEQEIMKKIKKYAGKQTTPR